MQPLGSLLKGLNDEKVTALTVEHLKERDIILKLHQWTAILSEMTPSNCKAIYAGVVARHASGADTQLVGELCQVSEGQVLRAAGMDDLVDIPEAEPGWPFRNRLRGWASVDPQGARKWIDDRKPGKSKNLLTDQWRLGVAQAQPEFLAQVFPALPPKEQVPLVSGMMSALIDKGGLKAARVWYDTIANGSGVDVGRAGFHALARRMAQAPLSGDDLNFVKSEAARYSSGTEAFRAVCGGRAHEQPDECFTLLGDLSATCADVRENLDSLVSFAVKSTFASSPETVGNWLNLHPEYPLRDLTVMHFAKATFPTDPASALQWVETIGDSAIKEAALAALEPEPKAGTAKPAP